MNPESKCGNCRFRGPPVREMFQVGPIHSVRDEYFGCELIKQFERRDDNDERPPIIDPVVVDGSGYFAAICVPEDFACNRWQPKENTP